MTLLAEIYYFLIPVIHIAQYETIAPVVLSPNIAVVDHYLMFKFGFFAFLIRWSAGKYA